MPIDSNIHVLDPDSRADWRWDWSDWLAQGDTISVSDWIVDPLGLVADDPDHDGTGSTVWLSGGVVGATYLVTNRIETAQGRKWDYSARFRIRQR